MLKIINKAMAGYGWNDANDFVLSIFPSSKYHMTNLVIIFTSVFASFEVFLGLTHSTMVAFAVLALTEVTTGLYASVIVRKEPLESGKMGRFMLKLAVLMVVIYVVHTFKLQFENKNIVLHTLFDWMYSGVFAYTALEYLVSVLENISVITGKESSTLILAIKEKLQNILKL